MTPSRRYVLDANVFIEAHKRYYAFDICPGFWVALFNNHGSGRICSIDRVRAEIVGQDDALSNWAQGLPSSFFAGTADSSVGGVFANIMTWVQSQSQYLPAAKTSFASGADGWLVAYAKTQSLWVATDEMANPNIKRKVPIPNVCDAFGVDYLGSFDLLRALGAKFR